jgi:hypothetical protein
VTQDSRRYGFTDVRYIPQYEEHGSILDLLNKGTRHSEGDHIELVGDVLQHRRDELITGLLQL